MKVAPRFVLILCVVVTAMTLGAPNAFAASPSTAYDLTSVETPFPQPTGRFGERHAATDDIDGDGVNDYFVGDLSEDVGGITNAGEVYAISGRTRAVIYRFLSPEIQANANFAFFISVIGDVDGDGKNDIASGTDSQDATDAGAPCTPPAAATDPPNGCNKDQGKAWVFSGGKGGKLLYAVNNPNPQSDGRFGSRIGRAGDIVKADGTPGTDGVPESIMGAARTRGRPTSSTARTAKWSGGWTCPPPTRHPPPAGPFRPRPPSPVAALACRSRAPATWTATGSPTSLSMPAASA